MDGTPVPGYRGKIVSMLPSRMDISHWLVWYWKMSNGITTDDESEMLFLNEKRCVLCEQQWASAVSNVIILNGFILSARLFVVLVYWWIFFSSIIYIYFLVFESKVAYCANVFRILKCLVPLWQTVNGRPSFLKHINDEWNVCMCFG